MTGSLVEEFPLIEEVVYLDNAATTLTPASAGEEIERFVRENGGNYGRGGHSLTREVTSRYEEVREELKEFLGVDDHLVITKSSTEALNLAAEGLELGGNVVTSDLEHHSCLVPLMRAADELRIVKHRGGVLDPEDFRAEVDDSTSLVAVSHVSNVYGSVQPVGEIAEVAHDHCALAMVDGAQSTGHLPLDVGELGADLFAFSGHKGLLGPQGTGGLALTEEVAESLDPLLLGGGSVHSVTGGYELEPPPTKFESGTPNIPGVVGLGASLKFLREFGVDRADEISRSLAEEAADRLSSVEGVSVHRPGDSIGIVSFVLEGWNPHDVANVLDRLKGVCVRSGYHCAIPALEGVAPSGTVRASFALYNTEEDIDSLVGGVKAVLELS